MIIVSKTGKRRDFLGFDKTSSISLILIVLSEIFSNHQYCIILDTNANISRLSTVESSLMSAGGVGW